MANVVINIGGYTIVQRLGYGARSTIYLATDDQTKDKVAVKRVIYEKAEDARIFEQVETEYKVANLIDHPYIRKCYKLKKIRSMLKVRELILAMEYFDGVSLEDGPTLSLVDVLLVFRMVATALNAMHQHGFVHCVIKPNNILINKSGSIKIIDLGQSCRIGTTKQRIQGTPDYIAPEQVMRKPLGPKTDIFNLGATMYWALTGHNVPTMIPKKNAGGLAAPVPEPCKTPHKIKKLIPIEISALVMDCVKDDPVNRPQNMLSIITRLDEMIHDLIGDKIKVLKNGSSNN
ncbi:MAG: serine/threonine protein kinase [Candidatus Brocadiia bacterium]|nr:MAG: serine/threonine protein kinase [Candidatus Brocadiia bacterium]